MLGTQILAEVLLIFVVDLFDQMYDNVGHGTTERESLFGSHDNQRQDEDLS